MYTGTEGQWVIVQVRKCALYHRFQRCQTPVQGCPLPPLYCPQKVPKALVEAIRVNSNTMMCMCMCSSRHSSVIKPTDFRVAKKYWWNI